eukprot:c12622_g1_i1.p1 GENE.c12622_g1_i1~~c12622_g1_i1.p1  ORF type:complete len:185 (+),score=35.22 c12622_g1_i1:133-687(+)
MAAIKQQKLVVVGDGAVGKTCLLARFARDEFNENYVPTVFENYVAEITVDGVPVELSLWDTAGQEDYDRLRPLSYTDTDVVLICYCINRPETLKNIELKWRAEVRNFCPDVPVLLIGTKSDLRGSATEAILPADVSKVAALVGAVMQLECSALTREGVTNVFESASRQVLENKKAKPKRKCVLL